MVYQVVLQLFEDWVVVEVVCVVDVGDDVVEYWCDVEDYWYVGFELLVVWKECEIEVVYVFEV